MTEEECTCAEQGYIISTADLIWEAEVDRRNGFREVTYHAPCGKRYEVKARPIVEE